MCASQFGPNEAGCALGGVGAACLLVFPLTYKTTISCWNLRRKLKRKRAAKNEPHIWELRMKSLSCFTRRLGDWVVSSFSVLCLPCVSPTPFLTLTARSSILSADRGRANHLVIPSHCWFCCARGPVFGATNVCCRLDDDGSSRGNRQMQ